MADDIVSRLRARPNNQWMLEAADEIERLRAEVTAWRNAAEAYERGAMGHGDVLVQEARRG